MTFTARLIRQDDKERCAEWVTNNPDIPREDKRMVDYPSALTICVEKDGEAVVYVPLHLQLFIGFLGFNPEIHPKDKARALRCAMDAAKRLCNATQVREIHVATMPDYPMGKWAVKHGFKDSEKHDLYWEVGDVFRREL